MNILQDILWDKHTLDMVGCNYCIVTWAPLIPALLNRPTINLQKTVTNKKSKKSKSSLGFCFSCLFSLIKVLLINLYEQWVFISRLKLARNVSKWSNPSQHLSHNFYRSRQIIKKSGWQTQKSDKVQPCLRYNEIKTCKCTFFHGFNIMDWLVHL